MNERVEQISKQELIARIHSERQRLEDTLAQLNEEQLIQPIAEEAWSVKDILAHITIWEQRMMRWINETIQGEIPEMPAPSMTWDDLDKLNNQSYQQNHEKSLEMVLAEFNQSFLEVLEVVENIPEEILMEKERFSWREGNSLWKMVAANTWWHYKMHNETISNGIAKSDKV